MTEQPKKLKFFWIVVILLVVGIIFQIVNYQMGKVEVVVYGTSTDTITTQVISVLDDLEEKFEERMKLDINMVGRSEEDGTISSYQTSSEDLADFDITENQRQMVIKKYYPNRYLDYLRVRNTDVLNANWQYFAQYAKIDAQKISEKMSEEGEEILRKEIEGFEAIRQELPAAANSLPLVYINGQLYKGSVDHFSLSAAIVKPILRGWHDKLPEKTTIDLLGGNISFRGWTKFQYNGVAECYNDYDCDDRTDWNGTCADLGTETARCIYSQPAIVDLTVLTDSECLTCNSDYIVSNLTADFKGLKVAELDVNSTAGTDLKETLGIKALPVFLFDQSIEDARNFSAYGQLGYLGQISEDGEYKYLLTQSGIPGALLDREEQDNTLDLYAMSHCPYSIALENSLIELAEDINFDLNIHYVLKNEIDEEGNITLLESSLNGQAEFDEDIRQLVIQKYYPDQFLDYLAERNKDITAEDWQSVATEAGIDVSDVLNKADAEGTQLLLDDAQTALNLGINSAPAYLWENKYFGFGISELIQFAKFKDLEIRDEDIGFCINS